MREKLPLVIASYGSRGEGDQSFGCFEGQARTREMIAQNDRLVDAVQGAICQDGIKCRVCPKGWLFS
ncbi:hypothetical protein AA0311_0311 [Asaia bogorensis NBRC 16594]|nr:hypothetical protein Asbog_00634 [Asaia bogorensis NBRC 16594]GBQ73793.1 hypothetical protein AA0311_0311 [Asaia bogorensis NBRC 16594]